MKRTFLLIPLLFLTSLAHAESWKVQGRTTDLKTGEPMLQLFRLTSDGSFEECQAWARGGGGLDLPEGGVETGQGSMFFLAHEDLSVNLGCNQVTKTMLQYFLQLPEAMAEEHGLDYPRG